MRKVNVDSIKQFVTDSGCEFVGISEPINFSSVVTARCSCGAMFSQTLKQQSGYKNRKSKISCGCIDKRWTNSNIDSAVQNRGIIRLTNCNVKGFQPSVTKIEWKCNKCGGEWNSCVDSVINKKSGCPKCAGNVPYTISSLSYKLNLLHRSDLVVLDIFDGSYKHKISRRGLFKCVTCANEWTALIHVVIRSGCGCPKCNDNVGTRIEVNGVKFHSKLEYYFWKRYHEKDKHHVILLQHRYLPTRRLTCDFYIPELKAWIEVTGEYMMRTEKYSSTIGKLPHC